MHRILLTAIIETRLKGIVDVLVNALEVPSFWIVHSLTSTLKNSAASPLNIITHKKARSINSKRRLLRIMMGA